MSIRMVFCPLGRFDQRHRGDLQPGADADHYVRVLPERIGLCNGQPQLVRIADDAATAAEGYDGRLESLSQSENLIGRTHRAAADENHGCPAGGDQTGRFLHPVSVDRR